MLKLLAYFDEATVLLYFAQSVFGENKHKPIVSQAEEKNHNGKEGRLCWTEPKQKIYNLAVL